MITVSIAASALINRIKSTAPATQHGQKSPPVQPLARRRSLHRTLSDESIYRGQRLPCLSDSVTEPTLGADVLFSCSTLPRSPTTRGVPLRRPSYKLGVKLHGRKKKEREGAGDGGWCEDGVFEDVCLWGETPDLDLCLLLAFASINS